MPRWEALPSSLPWKGKPICSWLKQYSRSKDGRGCSHSLQDMTFYNVYLIKIGIFFLFLNSEHIPSGFLFLHSEKAIVCTMAYKGHIVGPLITSLPSATTFPFLILPWPHWAPCGCFQHSRHNHALESCPSYSLCLESPLHSAETWRWGLISYLGEVRICCEHSQHAFFMCFFFSQYLIP